MIVIMIIILLIRRVRTRANGKPDWRFGQLDYRGKSRKAHAETNYIYIMGTGKRSGPEVNQKWTGSTPLGWGERSGPEVNQKWAGTSPLRPTSGPILVRFTSVHLRPTLAQFGPLLSHTSSTGAASLVMIPQTSCTYAHFSNCLQNNLRSETICI